MLLRRKHDESLKGKDPMQVKKSSFMLTASLVLALAGVCPLEAAEILDQLITGGKKEGEIVFIAGAQTFGGRKAFSELEGAFNNKYGLKTRINFTPGPTMSAVAARVVTELKAGRKSSTDFYLGSEGHFANFHQEKALEKVNWSEIFPWMTKEMEVVPNEGVLVYTDPKGMMYNSKLISKEKAPKRYEDLIDPRLSPTWAGQLAIPPHPNWLVQLSLIWGEVKVKDFARKLVAISGGRLRGNETERIVSGEFPIMAYGSLAEVWQWQARGAPLATVPGSAPVLTSYFQLGVPKNSTHPNLAKLFVAFMTSKEAQAVLEKYEFHSSHLVEGTIMAKHVRDNQLQLQDANKSVAFYLKGGGIQLLEEFAKILRQ